MLTQEDLADLNHRLAVHARPHRLIAFATAVDDGKGSELELTAAVWVAGRMEAHSELVSQSAYTSWGPAGLADRFVAFIQGVYPSAQ